MSYLESLKGLRVYLQSQLYWVDDDRRMEIKKQITELEKRIKKARKKED